MKLVLIISLGLVLGFSCSVDALRGCEDWEPFKDEKCFKVIDSLANYTVAKATCASQSGQAQLLSIGSPEEQSFLEDYLFMTSKVVDNVWLGAQTRGGQFYEQDGNNLTYKPWLVKSSKNGTNSCVQMNSEEGLKGNWAEVSCSKKNLVVCEKVQNVTLEGLKRMIIDLRKQLEKSNEGTEKWMILDLQKKIKKTNDALEGIGSLIKVFCTLFFLFRLIGFLYKCRL